MIMVWLIGILVAGGIVAWIVGARSPAGARYVSLAALVAGLVLALTYWPGVAARVAPGAEGSQWAGEVNWPWIPLLGARFHLAVDGLSLILVLLTLVLGVLSVWVSWTEITARVGAFHASMLWVLAGIVGVFLARDLFLFYFFWELMLVPMYFLIVIWGHEQRVFAAIKFFIFTQGGGLLMLVSIVALALIHRQQTGVLSFAYADLSRTTLSWTAEMWLMLGFFIAFAVKLPIVPLHTWLPDAHTQAPTAGSVILAGLLLKTGAYGLLRFAVPLFPGASATLAPLAMILGVVGILYGAWVAFAQTDLKRLVAYTSVSHLGFVLLGIYARTPMALEGAVLQMVCHGLSTGGLFMIVGMLQERTGTRDLGRLGGLTDVLPRMGAAGMILAMASLGLPGLGNFIAEFLILAGTLAVSVPLTALATLGLVAATIYALRFVQQTFHGRNESGWDVPDLNVREIATVAVVILMLIWLGLRPQATLDAARRSLQAQSDNTRAIVYQESP
jgi:NADH-quinone oxidoreductase subunit M